VDTPLKRTPLFEAHVAAGARMVPFGGWEMPVQYRGIVEEHRTVRSAVGLFDVSHMGEFEVTGSQALAALQSLTTNDVSALEIGQVQYSLLCLPDGGIVDDLTLYRLGTERFMLTVNAANIDKDWAWVTEQSRQFRGAAWRNTSAGAAPVAGQGPKGQGPVGRPPGPGGGADGLLPVPPGPRGRGRGASSWASRWPTARWPVTATRSSRTAIRSAWSLPGPMAHRSTSRSRWPMSRPRTQSSAPTSVSKSAATRGRRAS